jgi:outer membrane protein
MRFFTFWLLLISFTGFSQAPTENCHRIAHVDVEYVLSVWQKVQDVDSTVYNEKFEYETQFEPVYKEYLQVEDEINSGVYKEGELEDKKLQFQQLQTRVQQFSYSAKKRLVDRQRELMKPLLEKVKMAINDIAYEGNYDYVLSSTSGDSSLVLFCKNGGNDVTDQLLTKLSIK